MKKNTSLALSWGAAITFVMGLLASTLGAWFLERVNAERAQEAIIAATEQAADLVLTRLNLYQYGLRGARGAVVTAGEYGITRDLFDP